jgi:hypothetical protein
MRIIASVSEKIGQYWCRWMHREAMWPLHGEYQCRACLRRYPVRWESNAAEIETQSRRGGQAADVIAGLSTSN